MSNKDNLNLALVLQKIASQGCESFTGDANCWTAGRNPMSPYGAENVCNPCLAQAALDSIDWRQEATPLPVARDEIFLLAEIVKIAKYLEWDTNIGRLKAQRVAERIHMGIYGKHSGIWVQADEALEKLATMHDLPEENVKCLANCRS